jgi:hypothetical protein
VYNTYNTTGMILTDEELFKKVRWSVGVGGDKRLIRDMVILETNRTYTQRKLDKFDAVLTWWGASREERAEPAGSVCCAARVPMSRH